MSALPKRIARGSGGGSKSRAPIEAPNTLRAKQTLKMVHLISEGPIKGLTRGGQSIFLDNVPVIAPDGSANFTGLTWEFRTGTSDQDAIAGYPTAEETVTGPGLVLQATPAAPRSVDCTGRDRIKVTVSVNAIYKIDTKTGDQNPNQVAYRVEWRRSGGSSWSTLYADVIRGKSVSAYARTRSTPVPYKGQIDLRVIRETADPTSASDVSQIYWTSYATVVDRKMSYAGCALLALTVDGEQFQGSLPTLTVEPDGILCEVPTNYDPETRWYTGVWDGTFKQAHTDNPAWIFWTLATNPYWGAASALAGSASPSEAYSMAGQFVDRWLLYAIAQHCDEAVDDGYGGNEPRYRFAAWINTQEEAFRVLQAVASSFRSMLYWGAGHIVPVQDVAKDPAKLVHPGNVIGGTFEYEGTSLRARHSVVHVRWSDPDNNWAQTIEVVEDAEMIAEVGVRVVDYEAVGCFSRGQARRMGRWVLYTEKYETGIIRYSAYLDHANVRPGDIIAVLDPKIAGAQNFGRLACRMADSATLQLDRSVTLSAGQTYAVRLALPSGIVSDPLSVTTATGVTTDKLTIAGYPSGEELCDGFASWMLIASNLAPTTWRVMQVAEASDGTYAITATRHYQGKEGLVERNEPLDDAPFTLFGNPGGVLPPPTGLVVAEYLTGVGSTTLVRADFSWQNPGDSRIRTFEAQALQNGTVIAALGSAETTVTFNDLSPGTYLFQVRAVGPNGIVSAWAATSPTNIDGRDDPPGQPTNLVAIGGVRANIVRWSNPDSRTLKYVEVFASSNSTRSAASVVGRSTAGEFVHSGLNPEQTRWYWIRAMDAFGQYSAEVGPVSATTSLLIAADIAQGIIDTAKIASGLALNELITGSSLPTTGNFEGRTIVMVNEKRQYTYLNGQWVKSVADLPADAQLTSDQIVSLAAAKVIGQLTSSQIASLDAAKIAGQLVDSQLAGLTAGKLIGSITDSQIASISAAKLTTQITSTQITDGAISTPKLAAGAVTAATIAAGAVTAASMGLTDQGNLALNGDFDQGTDGLAGWSRLFNSPVVVTSGLPSGNPWPRALKLTRGSSDGETSISSGAVSFGADTTLQYGTTVAPGEEIYAEAWVWSSATATQAGVEMVQRKTDGSVASMGVLTSGVTVAANTWTKVSGVVAVAVAGAAYIRLCNYLAGSTLYFANVKVRRRYGASLIVDGSISTAKLDALAVTAAKLAANSVTAGKIEAGAVTTGALAASSVTAEKIAVGSTDNLIWNACCPNDAAGWLFGGSAPPTTYGANGTQVSGWSSWRLYGAGSLGFQTASIPSGAYMSACWIGSGDYRGSPCQSGQWWNGSAWLIVIGCNAKVAVEFFDYAGNFLGGGTSAVIAPSNPPNGLVLDQYQRVWCKALAPSGANFVRLNVLSDNAPSGGWSNCHIFATQCMLGTCLAGAAGPAAFVAGGVTEITGSQVKTGTILARNIAAGAVTTEKLSVGGGNIIWNSCVSNGTDGWAGGPSANASAFRFWVAKNWTPSLSLLGYGSGALQMVDGYGLNGGEIMHALWRPTGAAQGVPVTPNTRYQASALLQALNCAASVGIIWLDGSNNYISEVRSGQVTTWNNYGTADVHYTRASVLGTAPSNAVWGVFRVLGEASNGQAWPCLLFTKCLFGEATPNATEASAWTPGGTTDISGGIIRTNSISADRILANSIGTRELIADQVRAAFISVGAIRADEIAAGAIRAQHIASETVITQSAQIGTAVINSAHIQDAVISNAKIGNLQVDTIKIAGSAVTNVQVTQSRYTFSMARPTSGYKRQDLLALGVHVEGDGNVLIWCRLPAAVVINGTVSSTPGDGGGGGGDG